jgi:hypothetical protein
MKLTVLKETTFRGTGYKVGSAIEVPENLGNKMILSGYAGAFDASAIVEEVEEKPKRGRKK